MTGDPSALLDLLTTISRLKHTKRTGWIDRGADPAITESVADHIFMTAMTAWILALDRPELDADRVLKLAMVHDIAESLAGDIPPYDRAAIPDDVDGKRAFFSVRHSRSPDDRAAKQAAEASAFARLSGQMSPGAFAELSSLWHEYEAGETPEARFTKEVDTFDAYLASRQLARLAPDLPLGGFSDMADKELADPVLLAVRDAQRRTEEQVESNAWMPDDPDDRGNKPA